MLCRSISTFHTCRTRTNPDSRTTRILLAAKLLGFMYDQYGTDLRQWKNVYLTHIVEVEESPSIALKGTLFLTEHETRILIHWVPDPDQDHSLPDSLKKGYELDVCNLKHLICRRLPGFRYRALYLALKNSSTYGPFTFRTGGASNFIDTLGKAVILTRSAEDTTLYFVRPRPPQPYSFYRLPTASSRLSGTKVSSELGIFGNSRLVEVGASFRRLGRNIPETLNTFLDNILNAPEVVQGRELDDRSTFSDSNLDDERDFPSVDRLRTTVKSDFAVVEMRPNPIPLPPLPTVYRSEPLNLSQWKRHLDPYGRVTCVEKLRQLIFEGGVEPTLRPLVWKYLLGYYLWDNTNEENEARRLAKHREYHTLKKFWKEMTHDRLVRFSLFRDRKCYIDKDVPRTDRKTCFYRDDSSGNLTHLYDILLTYSVYNMDFGYYQGMNDLLALVLYVVQQEEDAFWCFVGLMERLESNFDGDLNAVREQFYQLFELVEILDPHFSDFLESKNAKEMPFCFRWLLIQFKREFSYSDVMVLWEAIWSEYLTKNFHIFFAAAVLLMQRHTFMERNYDANSILKHVNELSFNISLEPALNLATAYVKQLDQVLHLLPESVKNIIYGPSLSASIHSAHRKNGNTGTNSGDISPRLDYTWGLLNEELEDLLATDCPEPSSNAASPSLMIPIPRSESPKDFNPPVADS